MKHSIFSNFIIGIIIVSGLSACTKTSQAPAPDLSVESSGAVASQEVTTSLTGTYIARGTEPFWAAEITGTGVVFSRPGETGVDTTSYSTTQTSSGSSIVIKDLALNIEITLTPGSCGDGMSDTVYLYNATTQVGTGGLLMGCAN